MKHTLAWLALGALVAIAGVAVAEKPATVKLGVYDSRAVAVAWARSPAFMESMQQMRQERDRAKEAGDQKKVEELERQGPWMQVRMHQRGFSTAGAADLLGDLRADLPAIAKEAGVIAIVSKWELPYCDASVEQVDVTLQVAGLFHPDEATLKIIGELQVQAPIPFDELPLDAND
jgi:hypothetical protein